MDSLLARFRLISGIATAVERVRKKLLTRSTNDGHNQDFLVTVVGSIEIGDR